jgi:hypothetical protein
MRFVRSLIIASLVVVAPALAAAQAKSDALKGFWQKGDATDFKTPVHENSSNAVVYRDYPATVDEVKLRIQREAEEAVQSAQIAVDNSRSEAAGQAENPQKTPLTREQIIAKFGAPNEPSPIRAQKDSPPEMKALFEALNAGDKELAWQYSVALAERNNRIKTVVSKATDYQLLAMEATGQRESDANPATDEVGATRYELRDLIEKTKLERSQRQVDVESQLKNAGSNTEADSWSTASVASRQAALERQIPVDPAGKVKLLIFFEERSSTVKDFAKSLKPLQDKFKGDPNVSIIGLTMRTYTVPGLKTVGANTSFPFPLVNGEALAPELRIQRYPTFVFLAVSSKQTYHLEGQRKVEEIEKVLNVMRGQK